MKLVMIKGKLVDTDTNTEIKLEYDWRMHGDHYHTPCREYNGHVDYLCECGAILTTQPDDNSNNYFRD